jgi:arabinogalactan oligomer/maltooligosaccharide transport system substrate-binding protein
VVRTAATSFTTTLGIEVEIVELRLDLMQGRILGDILAGTGPDIFAGQHTWLGTLLPSDAVGASGLTARADEFTAIGAAGFTVDGEMYGLPVSVSAPALFSNPQLVDQVPIGFAQIKNDCEELGDSIENCLVVPTDDPALLVPYLTAMGAYLVGSNDEGPDPTDVGIDNDGAVAGAEFLRDLITDGFIAAAGDEEAAIGPFATEFVPFILGDLGTARLLEDRSVDFEIGRLPLAAGETPIPLVTVEGFFLSARSGQPEAAGTFLRDYLATPGTMQALYDATGKTPAHALTAETTAVDPVTAAFLSSAADGRPLPAVAGIRQALGVLQPAFVGLFGEEADVALLLGRAAGSARSILDR